MICGLGFHFGSAQDKKGSHEEEKVDRHKYKRVLDKFFFFFTMVAFVGFVDFVLVCFTPVVEKEKKWSGVAEVERGQIIFFFLLP